MVHIHNVILLSHKKDAFESVLMRLMNLQPIVQSKVSQKEKDGETDIENRLMDMGEGRRG